MPIHAPNLKNVGSDLNVMGDKSFQGTFPFPLLENIGGSMIIANTGMKTFPKSIKHVGSHVIISDQEPQTLVNELKEAKRAGIIKGVIMCIITP
jgi:hypothetical protein